MSYINLSEERQEGKFTMQGIAFTNLIHNLVREYGQYKHGSYSLDVDQFDLSDKRLVLSHMESAEWYEYACESPTNTEALFLEHKDFIQKLCDEERDEVYKEDMEEMRAWR